MTRGKRQSVYAAIAACFAVAIPSLARGPGDKSPGPAQDAGVADDEGPIVIGERPEYEKLYLARPAVALDLTNVYQRDKTSTDAQTSKSKQYLFEQLLEVQTSGYVLSPNFIILSLAGSGGVNENWVETTSDGESESSDSVGTLYEWDVQSTFQPNGDSPTTAYSRREQGWVFREFGPALETVTTDTGASVDLRSRTLPTRFSVSHLESEQSGIEDFDDFTYTRDAFTWHSTYLISENQTAQGDYTFTDVAQDGITNQEYQTHDAALMHEYVFGRRGNSLVSSFNYYEQTGDLDLERFRFDERLNLQHNDDFRTRYNYTYDQTDVGGSDRNRHRGLVGFTHYLYESLITTGDAGIQRTEAGGATSTETFGNLDVNYRKYVPLGMLSANVGVAWSRQDSENQTEPVQVINQPAAFSDAQPIVIVGNNVDPASLVITDPSGLLIFQEGLDYTVTQFADRVEIDRIVGGRIGSGEAVSLDYQLTPLPAAVTTSNSIGTGLRYDFQQGPLDGLSFYGRYAQANQDIDTDDPGAFVVNEFEEWVYGAEYRLWHLTLGAEHQDHDSTINPFEADRFYARYSQPVMTNTILALTSSYTSIDYFEPQNELNLFTVSAQIQQRITQQLTGSAIVLFRDEDDELRGRTTGLEQQLELRWWHRQTQFYAVVRNAQLETPSEDQSFQFFQIGIRREF